MVYIDFNSDSINTNELKIFNMIIYKINDGNKVVLELEKTETLLKELDNIFKIKYCTDGMYIQFINKITYLGMEEYEFDVNTEYLKHGLEELFYNLEGYPNIE